MAIYVIWSITAGRTWENIRMKLRIYNTHTHTPVVPLLHILKVFLVEDR